MTTALEALRNVAFVGHPSSGKTTLVDSLAFQLGASSRKGSVAEKTSICDTEPEEQEKGHTLQLAVAQAGKDGISWSLIDSPGYPDFLADAVAAMGAADLVVGVVSASGPVTFNLRNKMEAAASQHKGRAIVVTHVDGENSDFDRTVEELREKLDSELEFDCLELQKELFDLRFKSSAEGIANPSRISEIRREIARIKTLLRERQLGVRGAQSRA